MSLEDFYSNFFSASEQDLEETQGKNLDSIEIPAFIFRFLLNVHFLFPTLDCDTFSEANEEEREKINEEARTWADQVG